MPLRMLKQQMEKVGRKKSLMRRGCSPVTWPKAVHLIYTLPISGIRTASRTIGVNSQESVHPRELIRDTLLNRVDSDARLTQRCCALPKGTA